ncbi:MAG TPA: SMC-Scp complex subunit ScpB [Candidatus Dormibacteraeota bacterium]|nr:SMC-Scp complex subunit ScpB [Candidatus Dormibacteraeota bacterium]
MSNLAAQLEAILFSSNRPLKVRELQQATDSGRDEVEHALDSLRSTLEGRGVMLMRHHDELHLATRPEYAAAVRRALRPEVSGKLSAAAYETLAIVAYNQPVARSRIEEVRGVNCESVLTNLELRDLITEVGRGSGPGQPKLYGTTMRFLQVLGLESLDHLPTPGSGGQS